MTGPYFLFSQVPIAFLLFVHLKSYTSIRSLICSCCKKNETNGEEDLDGTREFRDQNEEASQHSDQNENLQRAPTSAIAINVADLQILTEDDFLSDQNPKSGAFNNEEALPRFMQRKDEVQDERPSSNQRKQGYAKRNTCHIDRTSEKEDEMGFTYQIEQTKSEVNAKQRVVSGQINISYERSSDPLINDN